MTTLFRELIVGLTSGAIYALIALGYTMVYGIIELINFAHGDIFMIGSFVAISIVSLFGISSNVGSSPLSLIAILLVATLGAMLACAILGVVIERVAYRPLRNAPRLAPLISAIGVSLILEDAAKLWKGYNELSFPAIFPQYTYCLYPIKFNGGFPPSVTCLDAPANSITISSIYILVIVLALLLMVALQLFVTRTRTGRAMRAVAQDREAAALMGVNVDRIISITFFIGAALAGAAGVVFGLYHVTTDFTIGYQLGLIAFTAAVLGGIGNIVGAMLGGIIIGLIEALVTLIPDSNNGGFGLPHGGDAWTRAVVFGILILILVFRPSGLLGQHTPEKV